MKFDTDRRLNWNEIAGVLVAFALLGSLMLTESCSWLEPSSGSKAPNKASAGSDTAIDFTAKNLDGKQVRLSDFRGQVVLVNFWAIWCGPCQEEIPELEVLYRTYHEKGLVILGVSDPSELTEIKNFVNEYKMPYPVVIDPGNISDEYNVVGFPTSFLIDREGRIVQKYPGYSPSLRKKLETQILKLL